MTKMPAPIAIAGQRPQRIGIIPQAIAHAAITSPETPTPVPIVTAGIWSVSIVVERKIQSFSARSGPPAQ